MVNGYSYLCRENAAHVQKQLYALTQHVVSASNDWPATQSHCNNYVGNNEIFLQSFVHILNYSDD